MESYPTQLISEPEELPSDVPQNILGDQDLRVVQGLNVALAEQLIERSREPHIVEFCANDSEKRFRDLSSIEAWQLKGRLALPLVRPLGAAGLELMGMAWMGPGKPAERESAVPGASITFAIRLYTGALGKGNAVPYTRAVLKAHELKYGNSGVWLEAWGDNFAATATYAKAGFRQVARTTGTRHDEVQPRVYMTLDTP